MDERRVASAIRTSNIKQLVLSGIVLTIAIVIAAISTYPYILSRFQESETLTQAQVEEISLAMIPRYHVSITGDEAVDTGFSYEETVFGVIPYQNKHYGVLVINDRFLLFEVDGEIDESQRTVDGDLVWIPTEIQEEVVDVIVRDELSIGSDDFFPYMLSSATRQWVAGTILIVIVLALSGVFFVRSLLRFMNRKRHPIMQRLAKLGDPDNIIREATNDVRVFGTKEGNLHFGKKWLVYSPNSDFNAMRLEDLLWAHKHTTVNKSYGITTGKQHALHLYDRSGTMLTISGKEPVIEGWLTQIYERSPWTQIGWTQVVADAWQKDRAGFVKTIDDRRVSGK